ncbi:MAG: hypothetical protein OXG37_15655 [Actinomycetia bacterium]|nr:hypothetical protein [Actinomycetes bacterium]
MEPVLYRLPEVIAAVKAGGTVHVVEGEKCADALSELGFVATTNPGGAGKWRPEFSENVLAGTTRVVWADCDLAGRSHAHQIAQSLARNSCRVHIADLDTDRDDGYDIADRLHRLRKEDAAHGQLAGHIQEIFGAVRAWRRCSANGLAARRCPCLPGRRRDRRGRGTRRADALGSASTRVNQAAGSTAYLSALAVRRKQLGKTTRPGREGVGT